jgi:TRAP-type C4-dicarboxylate transport system substrate-binding protein
MKIRVMASPIETEVWTTFGAQPTTIPTPETYSALQTGVVAAAENAPIIIYSWKFYEPAPYYSLTEHQFFMSPVFVSDKTREKLPDDLEAIVMKCLEEASVYERKIDLEINDKALKDLAAAGCKINSDVDKQGFIGKLTSMQDKVAEQYKIQDVLKMIRDAK